MKRIVTVLVLALVAAVSLAGTIEVEVRGRLLTGKNFSGKPPILLDGDVLEGCNLSQPEPHTPVGAGVKGLIFRKCNLVNCDVPKDAALEKCLNVHMRKVVVETLTAAEVEKQRAEEEKAVAIAVKTIDEQRAAAVAAAIAAARAKLIATADKVAPLGLSATAVTDETGKVISYQFWRKEIVP